jgi:hypothetical protein
MIWTGWQTVFDLKQGSFLREFDDDGEVLLRSAAENISELLSGLVWRNI